MATRKQLDELLLLLRSRSKKEENLQVNALSASCILMIDNEDHLFNAMEDIEVEISSDTRLSNEIGCELETGETNSLIDQSRLFQEQAKNYSTDSILESNCVQHTSLILQHLVPISSLEHSLNFCKPSCDAIEDCQYVIGRTHQTQSHSNFGCVKADACQVFDVVPMRRKVLSKRRKKTFHKSWKFKFKQRVAPKDFKSGFEVKRKQNAYEEYPCVLFVGEVKLNGYKLFCELFRSVINKKHNRKKRKGSKSWKFKFKPAKEDIKQIKSRLLSLLYVVGAMNLVGQEVCDILPHLGKTMKQLWKTILYLEHNNLSGPIPTRVGGLKEIVDLRFSYNDLSDIIPESTGNCRKLEYMYLNNNKFNGSLPESLNLLENLGYLLVSNNCLEGRIYFGSSNCKKLVDLDLSFNDFEGSGHPEIGNCSSLEALVIIKCNLTSTIPSSLGVLQKVLRINLSENHLSGNIPRELGNCSSVQTLKLNYNQLRGEIPFVLRNLKKLESLELFVNKLSGEIPIDIWKIQSLTQVLVYNNTLTGELPVEATQLKHLKKLTLFNNSFYGEIPNSLVVNQSLEEVDLLGNSFTGELPPNLYHGLKLKIFILGFNQLHGKIPTSIHQCKTLDRVRLEENKLSGVLPEFPENPINLVVKVFQRGRI